jgi:glycosyltransferase involved in cell wall biosynthesis
MTSPQISVVLPAYNEEGNVSGVFSQICAQLERLPASFEVIYVDDGSTDNTAAEVKTLIQADGRVRLIRFVRNFGNQPALIAGIRAARGQAVITMDCDLQHPPSLLPRMIETWRGGFMIVQMVRLSNPTASVFRRYSSVVFNALLRRLSEIPLSFPAGDFLLLDRKAVKMLLASTRSQAFFRGAVQWLGLPTATIPFEAPARSAGSSNFTPRALCQLSWDMVTAVSKKPLRLSMYCGLVVILFLLLYSAIVIGAWMYGHSVPGYPSLVILIVIVGAMNLISIGLLGEYIGRIHDCVRNLPPYLVLEEAPPAEDRVSESGRRYQDHPSP